MFLHLFLTSFFSIFSILCFSQNFNPKWKCLGPSGTPEYEKGGYTVDGTRGNGQINRIVFDPNYNLSNQRIYACSFYGGLWRSENRGQSWNNLNTDLLLLTSAADVAIDYQNNQNIFLATGDGDRPNKLEYSPNWSHINPIFSKGIFRSTDDGKTWNDISSGLLEGNKQLVIRRLIIHSNNSNLLFAATNQGIFKCKNALGKHPIWNKIFRGKYNDPDFRGLEFHPLNDSIIYTSGKNIYQSKNLGSTWEVMTGENSGLNFDSLKFDPVRINLAITPADPNRVYAYIKGRSDQDKILIYVFRNNQWEKIYETNSFNPKAYNWMGFAASPINPDEVYFGSTVAVGNEDINTQKFYQSFSYWGKTRLGKVHPDVHALAYEPNTHIPNLFAGTHGGVSKKDLTQQGTNGWKYLNEGLEVAVLWSFDDSEWDEEIILTSNQDCGTNLRKNGIWKIIAGCDGYGVRIDDAGGNEALMNSCNYKRFDIEQEQFSFDEKQLMPRSPKSNFKYKYPNPPSTFPAINHPETGELYVGVQEVFRRKKMIVEQGDEWTDIWELDSDLSKSLERFVMELAFAPSNPNYIYVATLGQDSEGDKEGEPGFFVSKNGGNNGNYKRNGFKNVTANLPKTNLGRIKTPVITGIAVYANNPKKVWVSFIGRDENIRVWTSDDAGEIWTNADPNGILKDLPVNNIVCQSGTNERLYIATDRGIYTKDGASDWEKYGNFPNVRVTELKINSCIGKLRASTFGRGMWEGELIEPLRFNNDLLVKGKDTWSEERLIQRNLRLKKGAKLIVKADLHLPINGKIIVEPNAKLILDGAVVNNICGNSLGEINLMKGKRKWLFFRSKPGELILVNGGDLIQ